LPSGSASGGLFPERIDFKSSIFNSDSGEELTLKSNLLYDRLTYDINQTPLLNQVIPSQVYKGQTVSFVVKSAMNYHKRFRTLGVHEPVQNLQIDGVEANHEGFFDATTSIASGRDRLSALAGDQKPSKNSQP